MTTISKLADAFASDEKTIPLTGEECQLIAAALRTMDRIETVLPSIVMTTKRALQDNAKPAHRPSQPGAAPENGWTIYEGNIVFVASRIAEAVERAQRGANAKTTLSLHYARQMANACYNLKQDIRLPDDARKALGDAQAAFDAAAATLPDSFESFVRKMVERLTEQNTFEQTVAEIVAHLKMARSAAFYATGRRPTAPQMPDNSEPAPRSKPYCVWCHQIGHAATDRCRARYYATNEQWECEGA
ncbi:hypothetical protein BJ122_102211 [Rhodopseudomonas faecalis]|uniref:Uncharacterized protein n=1 Tax=Rhodopseudomonas faecalis TaxID=99655 RepID=A0A318TT10_9BRAD|nr:hypothetical protein [Rhodopseudomonas faecalis]PYF04985.1 hypothetical protein BJ122_102211 [Rhodopseudomonas faecalis]